MYKKSKINSLKQIFQLLGMKLHQLYSCVGRTQDKRPTKKKTNFSYAIFNNCKFVADKYVCIQSYERMVC